MKTQAADDLYFDELPCTVSVQNRDLRIIACNRRFAQHFPGSVGAFCYEVYKRRTEKCERCPVEATFADGRPHSSEERVTRRSGEEAWVLVRTAPVRDDSGRIVSVIEVSYDVTEIKQLQQRARATFDEAPCFISIQDREFRILEANRRFRTDFGEPAEGRCYEVYKHRTERCLVCPVADTFQDGEVHTSEEVVTSRDGRQVNVLVRTAPLRGPDGGISSVMEMSTNITELRRLQSQLASLGLVVGTISHGIKGLLNGLGGGIYLMETGFGKDDLERTRKGWEMVQRNVDRIRSMVLNVLYYAKDREPQWDAVDAADLVADVAGVLAARAQQLKVQLTTRVPEGAGTFEADPHAMHSLLVNLVENSFDACRIDKKTDPHRVELTVRRDDGEMVFEITDNGIGMDQESREKAFSPFFSSKGTEGTGLGLFIANKIAASHGGHISIDSTLHVGTRFTVRTPAARHRDPVAPSPAPAKPEPA
jgi:PAS domain S-box-containing protein